MKRLVCILLAFMVAGYVFASGKVATTEPTKGTAGTTVLAGDYLDKYGKMVFILEEYEEVTGNKIAEYHEAPILEAMVAKGELPPVEERLPEQPVVVLPIEEIGQYGGMLNIVGRYARGWDDVQSTACVEGLFRISFDGTEMQPNLVSEDWEFSEDATTLTLPLLQGIRWSDGVPFTADDVMFWYEDMLLNDEYTPVKHTKWRPGGELMKMEKLNDYTVQIRFAAPYPIILLYLGHYEGHSGGTFAPKHYMQQFHPRYAPKADLEKLMKEEGFETWQQLFNAKLASWAGVPNGAYTGLPTVNGFWLKESQEDHLFYERNPYYWKVDPAGNQLPYIDNIQTTQVSDATMSDMKIVTGECDFAAFNPSADNIPLYKDSAEEGNYRVLVYKNPDAADVYVDFNLTAKDPVMREILRDVRFRRAMSHALNREEMNETLRFGLATPRQTTVFPESPYYEEYFEKAYADYDPDEADALLDEMGLDKRDKEGYRLRPDGERLILLFEYCQNPAWGDPFYEMIKEYWEAVGVQTVLKFMDRSLLGKRIAANEVNVSAWNADKASDLRWPALPALWVPINTGDDTIWGYQWALWHRTDGKEGEEPPAEPKRLIGVWEEYIVTLDEERKMYLAKEILRSNAENLWTIGTVGLSPTPVIVRKNLRNVPETGLHGYAVMRLRPKHPEQFFFKQN